MDYDYKHNYQLDHQSAFIWNGKHGLAKLKLSVDPTIKLPEYICWSWTYGLYIKPLKKSV